MIFHIAVCSPDPVLRGRVERQCLEYYARRADACIVEQLPGVDALLARDAEGTRYELYLVELTAGNAPAGLKAADTLRAKQSLMSGKCKKVDVIFLHIDIDRTGTLCSVHGKEQMTAPAYLTNLTDWQNGSAYIGSVEHDDCFCLRTDQSFDRFRMRCAVCLCRNHRIMDIL